MPYVLDPLVAGQLAPGTVRDAFTNPQIDRLQYVLDAPTTSDLIESYPVFLVSEELAVRLTAAGMTGFRFDDAEAIPGENYTALYGDTPHKAYRWLRPETGATDPDAWVSQDLRLVVSDGMWEILRQADLSGCDVEPLS